MSCAGVANEFFVEIDVNVGSGDEVLLEFAAKSAIESEEDLGRFGSVRSLSSESDLNH